MNSLPFESTQESREYFHKNSEAMKGQEGVILWFIFSFTDTTLISIFGRKREGGRGITAELELSLSPVDGWTDRVTI